MISYLSVYLWIFSTQWTTKNSFIDTFSTPWTVKRAKNKTQPIHLFVCVIFFFSLLGKPSSPWVLVSQTIPILQPLAHSCFYEGNTDQLSCPVALRVHVILPNTFICTTLHTPDTPKPSKSQQGQRWLSSWRGEHGATVKADSTILGMACCNEWKKRNQRPAVFLCHLNNNTDVSC